MAGRPRTRAKRAAAEAAAAAAVTEQTIPDAVEVGESIPGGTTRSGARRARARDDGTPKAAHLPNVTRAADTHVATELEQLTRALKASLSVDIERTHPLWCKGWLETYDLQSPSIRELRAYIQDEYGGTNYRISVLNPAGAILYTATLPIAGQPKERGRVITRDSWDPIERAAAPVAAANSGGNSLNEGGLVREVLSLMRQSSQDQLTAVKDMISGAREETKTLIGQIVTVRASDAGRQSFAGQLNEIVETSTQLERVRKKLAGPPPAPVEAPAQGNDLDPLMREAEGAFARKVISTLSGEQQPQQPAQPQNGGAQQQQTTQRRSAPQGPRIRQRRPPPSPSAEEAESIPGFSRTAGHA